MVMGLWRAVDMKMDNTEQDGPMVRLHARQQNMFKFSDLHVPLQKLHCYLKTTIINLK